MTLDEIPRDVHILEMDLQNYARKYGVLSETFFDHTVSVKIRKTTSG